MGGLQLTFVAEIVSALRHLAATLPGPRAVLWLRACDELAGLLEIERAERERKGG